MSCCQRVEIQLNLAKKLSIVTYIRLLASDIGDGPFAR